ncbi:MAG: hypothetical protein ACOC7M_03855, partial [Chloroflexota bacterium]
MPVPHPATQIDNTASHERVIPRMTKCRAINREASTSNAEAALMYYSPMSLTLELDEPSIALFREEVYNHFREHGRAFAWRETRDTYSIL